VSVAEATFAYSSEDGSTFECSLDGSAFEPCSSPQSYADLSEGSHSDGSHIFSVRATDAAGNIDATPATTTFTPLETVTNVRDFGATGNGTSNAKAAFEIAMAEAARLGESTYVPSGTYHLAGVNLPNNTHLEVKAGVVFKKFGTANGPLFVEQGPTDTTFAHDIYIEGVGGKFTMDLNDAGAGTAAIRFSNVNGFSLKNADCIQNNDNQQMLPPTSYKPCLAFLSANTTLNNGVYNAPHDGVIDNVHSFKSPYGFGLTQFNGGSNIQLTNISSEGGVPLRVESFKSNATPMDNIIADGVTCKNGHDAVHMNPHGTNHGTITVRNVTVDSCESALSIKTDSTLGGSYASDSSIDGVTVIPGNLAQDRDSDPTNDAGSWVAGSSKWCIDNDDPLGYAIGLSNVDCGGLSNRHP
jgi:polygalacturonase